MDEEPEDSCLREDPTDLNFYATTGLIYPVRLGIILKSCKNNSDQNIISALKNLTS